MRLDLNIGYFGPSLVSDPTLIQEAERLGYRCVWVAEAYGSDAATMLGAIGAITSELEIGSAIFQMPARTPAMTAMTAATLDGMTSGRFRLGLGLSGPQVVEGWHGVPYGRPLARTREYVEIVRRVLARNEALTFDGEEYQIPFQGEGATGLGKPLKRIGEARPNIPIYLASIGPQNVRLTAEIADGWLPIFYSPERADEVFGDSLREGFERSGVDDKMDRFGIVASVQAAAADDIDVARDQIRPQVALYVGGMGARNRNFYFDLAVRYGFEREAVEIQDLYLGGDKTSAIAAVPDGLIDEVALVGSKERIRDRLDVWRESGVDAIAVGTVDLHTLRTVAAAAAT